MILLTIKSKDEKQIGYYQVEFNNMSEVLKYINGIRNYKLINNDYVFTSADKDNLIKSFEKYLKNNFYRVQDDGIYLIPIGAGKTRYKSKLQVLPVNERCLSVAKKRNLIILDDDTYALQHEKLTAIYNIEQDKELKIKVELKENPIDLDELRKVFQEILPIELQLKRVIKL
jgi:hypothetical protein